MPSNYKGHPDYRGSDKYKRKNARRRIQRAGGEIISQPKTSGTRQDRDGISVPRPRGVWWENRRRQVLRRIFCAYCGARGTVVDHVIPLSFGHGLAISTDARDHPLNSIANLALACEICNSAKSGFSGDVARRRIAEAQECEVSVIQMPDTAWAEDALKALERRSEPVADQLGPQAADDQGDAYDPW